jgi:hypothetical protein
MEGSLENKAYTQYQLNNILVCCIAEEKRLAISKNTPPTATPADPALRPTMPLSGPAQITLQFETELKYPVKYNNQTWMLSGIADYTLRYDSAQSVGINLIIVEAKRRRLTGEVAGQVLAYMGELYTEAYCKSDRIRKGTLGDPARRSVLPRRGATPRDAVSLQDGGRPPYKWYGAAA